MIKPLSEETVRYLSIVKNSIALSNETHESWLEDHPHSEILIKLLHSKSATPYLSDYLYKKFSLMPSIPSQQEIDQYPLSGLSRIDLQRIVHYISAFACQEKIRSAINREQVRFLIQTLGEEAYHFALYRAPLISISEENTECIERFLSKEEKEMGNIGLTSVLGEINGYPESLKRRIILRLPKGFSVKKIRKISKQEVLAGKILTRTILQEIHDQKHIDKSVNTF